ncbi:hypothetical protein [Lacticaseibacillus parakribbianus]|uniref:hypothetical protein n=1 Tax=Lacticaseibacillus parakribbianus TaxID=2970927 RepID=UPI0021CAF7FB|nr:hypothetical protein [Lacticaseibacillus parakribbianus]
MSVVVKLIIMVVAALIATGSLMVVEWRAHQASRANTGAKAALAVVLVGLLVSLLTHP